MRVEENPFSWGWAILCCARILNLSDALSEERSFYNDALWICACLD
jgi:hypothetical protein